ncbi:hypothetical protein EX895_006337 [Sporisorium graminicola]|uniref:Uncharacterized protein n=1 Tax=Sporisorium graminicola TaxID=280036 RepID=A0A4U7KN36_9BASI|nr:hypothetical protein EX895_006337 [Sporisorium graminicola]TKY85257.1 hypothetical protein EX895_006337 [Sporisorium graminicola]
MPLAAGLGGARPPGAAHKPANGSGPTPGPSRPNPKLMRDSAVADDDDDDQETTTDDSSDEEAAFEMDGQELWTQTYCVTCDCLIEPGEGIAKTGTTSATGTSPVTHTTLKSRSGTIKARGPSAPDTADDTRAAAASKQSPNPAKAPGPTPLKRTHSAGRLHAKAGAGPLGPHKRTGSAGSRLHALSELRPTTKLHDDKAKPKAAGRDASHGRKSPATSRPNSAASNRSHSNSSGPSSFKSNEATHASNANNTTSDSQARAKKRGFLGGLGLTPATLKQQEDELAAKRKAPTPLYCSERCRLIDERRSSGLGELTQYLSQPLVPPNNAAWATPPPPPHTWTRSASVSSMPLQMAVNTPESECLCPECMDKYADGSSASGAGIPSGASDTATESSSGYVYGRGAAQKPRTASGRLITPLGLHPPGTSTEGYFPQYTPSYAMTPAAQNSPRVRAAEVAPHSEAARYSSVPPRTSSAASAGKASTAGTEGSVFSSGSGSSLWEPRLKPRSNSGVRSSNGFSGEGNAAGTASGLSTSTATPAITPRQSMIVPSSSGPHSSARAARRLSVLGFAPTHEVDEEAQHQSEASRAISPAYTLPHRPSSRSHQASLLLATSPLKLLDKSSQHHAAPSIDLFSDHVGSPGAKGSLLSRSLASEHTLMGASGITLTNQHTLASSSSLHDHAELESEQPQRQASQDADLSGRRPTAMSQSYSYQSFNDPSRLSQSSRNADSSDSLSMAVGSLKLAQSRASGPLAAMSRRGTDTSESRPTDLRRLSLFGVAGAPARRNSNAVSISSSNSGSTSSGWLRSLSSAWLNWRSTASPAPMQTDSEVFHSMDDSDEWPSRSARETFRRESSASRSSSSQKVSYASKRASSTRDVSMARSSSQHSDKLQPLDDRSAAITPTQSLVAKPTIRRGYVPAYVSEIGQGDIPGDSLPADLKTHAGAVGATPDPAQRLARARVDSFTRVMDADAVQKKASKRRSRDISVLPPLLAPISRSGSSTNLYAQVPRSARAYSTGRTWSAANTPQMYVGSAGSSHQQPLSAGGHGQPPHSPTLMRSPYHSSLALTHDAARAALSPSRPNSAAGYHSLHHSAGTSPRAKGLGWGAMTSIASPPASSSIPHAGHRQSISYGHAAAVATRASVNQPARGHAHHHHQHHHHAHQHTHQHHHRHQHSWHEHGSAHDHSSSASDQHLAGGQGNERVALGHMMSLGAPPTSSSQAASSRHSTMPATLHRSPTPSVPEDGGEMSSHALTSGDFVSRPNSAMAGQTGRRHHRTSLMPPPRSRSSMGMHPTHSHHRTVQPSTATDVQPPLTPASEDVDAEDGVQPAPHHEAQREPPRTWSYDHLAGLKTYPILQLPDRETHDVYNPAWGLDAGGLAKHLGQEARLPRSSTASTRQGDVEGSSTAGDAAENGSSTVQMGFQPHRKKLFYFDA